MMALASGPLLPAPGWYAIALRHRPMHSASVVPLWDATRRPALRQAIVVDGRGVAGLDDPITPKRVEFLAAKALEERGLTTWVPAAAHPVARSRRRGVAKVPVLRPILPGYVLVELEAERDWRIVGACPMAAGVLAFGGIPAIFRPAELRKLVRCELREQRRWRRRDDPQPLPFRVSDLVEVIDGPFEGLKVEVLSILGKASATVLCNLFGRLNEVELGIEKLRAIA